MLAVTGLPADGRWAVQGDWYRLSGTEDGPVAILEDTAGVRWAELRLLATVDTISAADETYAVRGPAIEKTGSGSRLVWVLESSLWPVKRLVATAAPSELSFTVEIDGKPEIAGRTELTDVALLGGRAV